MTELGEAAKTLAKNMEILSTRVDSNTLRSVKAGVELFGVLGGDLSELIGEWGELVGEERRQVTERKKSLEDRQRKLDHREAQLAAEKESQTEKKARRAQMERRLEKLSKGLEGLSAKTDKSLETTEELRGGLMTNDVPSKPTRRS